MGHQFLVKWHFATQNAHFIYAPRPAPCLRAGFGRRFEKSLVLSLPLAGAMVRNRYRKRLSACPGPSGPPSLKMCHWHIFRALRALGDVHALGCRPAFAKNSPPDCFPGASTPADYNRRAAALRCIPGILLTVWVFPRAKALTRRLPWRLHCS